MCVKEPAAMEFGVGETLTVAAGVLLVPVVAFVASFVFWPGALLKAYNWYKGPD